MDIIESGDDGRIRTGTLGSATAHAFTCMFGCGILALPWSMAQLGWILGPVLFVFFAIIIYYTSTLLCDCYRAPDPIHGKRNPTYMDAVRSLLGPRDVLFCGIAQYLILWGTMIGYTITTAISIGAFKKSICFHKKGHDAECRVSGTPYLIGIGAVEIILSYFPNLEEVTILSVIATVTSFLYSIVALCLSIAKVISDRKFKGTIMVAQIGHDVAASTKTWHIFQALGNIALAYTISIVLLEIEDTIKSPPPENKVMKKASSFAIGGTAAFYAAVGFMGYSAFGNDVPGNILTGFYEPFWVVGIGNLAVIIHLIGAYQLFAQTIFRLHEKWLASKWPNCFLNKIYTVTVLHRTIRFTLSRALHRPAFVVLTTAIATMIPFFNAILALLGAIAFFPLAVYFPLSMYMVQANIKAGSSKWIFLHILGFFCLIVTLMSAIGSIADIVQRLGHVKLFDVQF